ncbi:MAG: PIN domain-containing protein, partial [Pseudonocardia sp.]
VRALRIRTCDIVVLELLRSARNSRVFGRQAELRAALDHCPLGASEVARARGVQVALAARGQHRGVPSSDLLIAASAEAGGVPVPHYDHDYDLIAEATGQPVRWVSPAGSLP